MYNFSNWNSKTDNFEKYKSVKSNLIYGKPLLEKPEVSIMLLTYKRADKLELALKSAINQTYKKPFVICVCDDSGFDGDTDKLMKKYCDEYDNILYYRHEKNIGQYANWNRACELCETKWYCLLHDDDMLKPNYLEVIMNSVKGRDDIGLIGVYEEANDTRNDFKKKVRIIDRFIDYFIKLRSGRLIRLNISDNIRHIYVMNSTFINKAKAYDIGGLDDSYFPSSDFAFSAKMAYHYSTYFMPIKLVDKGIGESESLKQSVCDDSIRCAYHQTYFMCKNKGMSDKKAKRKASVAAVISEIGVKGYNNVNYGEVKCGLGMKDIYNKPFMIFMINLYSKLCWGLLLFRR